MATKEKKNFKSLAGRIAANTNSFDNEMLQGITPKLSDESKPQHDSDSFDSKEDELRPFATRLPQSLILQLQQHQYWNRESIMDTVINALNQYLPQFPDSTKLLPAPVLAKKQNRKKRK
ncbi:hypothetical protein [Rufibacter hautae]|uniref:Uncharacterized protein n=1 Tax=Rufibacter hautae TaxID=2595005 RepID=A0A5B6T9Y6_9BACT|nr:hypothetical protein [Rufibacter hautae]KAA3435913.1 hypothetical protein FOA19_22985 [Rufibacter hautae]